MTKASVCKRRKVIRRAVPGEERRRIHFSRITALNLTTRRHRRRIHISPVPALNLTTSRRHRRRCVTHSSGTQHPRGHPSGAARRVHSEKAYLRPARACLEERVSKSASRRACLASASASPAATLLRQKDELLVETA